jgi:hypothetical protein
MYIMRFNKELYEDSEMKIFLIISLFMTVLMANDSIKT